MEDGADVAGIAVIVLFSAAPNKLFEQQSQTQARATDRSPTRLVKTASSGSFGFQGPGSRLIGSVQQFLLSIGGCDGRQWGWKT